MPQPAILPGLYRAGDRTINVLFSRGGMVRYWEIGPDGTDGKVLASMTLDQFQSDGFAKVGP